MARAIFGSSRREVVAGVATGIAAVAGGPPFPPQQQDPPGLAAL